MNRWTREPVRWLALACALGAAAFLGVMVLLLAVSSAPVLSHAGFSYLYGTRWFFRAAQFGAAPMLYGTVAVAAVALAVALPLGLGAAIWTAELLPGRARLLAKSALELLAGIPSVVYGLLGVLFVRDFVYTGFSRFEPLSGDTLLTAGLLVAVMVLPTLVALADDALRGVPAAQRHAARALGLTRAETTLRVVLPQALPGIAAAVLLALGRALGETIAVFLVVGRQDNQWPAELLSLRPLLEAGQTLATKLGGSETFIAYGEPLHWSAMLGLGLLLMAMVAAVTASGAALAQGRSGPGDERA